MSFNENKQAICDALLPVLQMTRNLHDLKQLYYDPEKERVHARFEN